MTAPAFRHEHPCRTAEEIAQAAQRDGERLDGEPPPGPRVSHAAAILAAALQRRDGQDGQGVA